MTHRAWRELFTCHAVIKIYSHIALKCVWKCIQCRVCTWFHWLPVTGIQSSRIETSYLLNWVPQGFHCNATLSVYRFYPFSHTLYSLYPHISLRLLGFAKWYMVFRTPLWIAHIVCFHVNAVSNAWNRWQRTVAIQTVYLLSASPETSTQSGLITVDSESLHTYCVVTFLLR